MVRQHRPPRKSAFRAALALAGTNQRKWAEDEGITPGHLSLVLMGKRESESLTAKIDAFIARYLPSVSVQAGRAA